jgi:hypothetical protein
VGKVDRHNHYVSRHRDQEVEGTFEGHCETDREQGGHDLDVTQMGNRHGEIRRGHPVAKIVIRHLDCVYFHVGGLLDEFQCRGDGEEVGE